MSHRLSQRSSNTSHWHSRQASLPTSSSRRALTEPKCEQSESHRRLKILQDLHHERLKKVSSMRHMQKLKIEGTLQETPQIDPVSRKMAELIIAESVRPLTFINSPGFVQPVKSTKNRAHFFIKNSLKNLDDSLPLQLQVNLSKNSSLVWVRKKPENQGLRRSNEGRIDAPKQAMRTEKKSFASLGRINGEGLRRKAGAIGSSADINLPDVQQKEHAPLSPTKSRVGFVAGVDFSSFRKKARVLLTYKLFKKQSSI